MTNAMKAENIGTFDRVYKEIIGHSVKIGVLILKIVSVEKSTHRSPLHICSCVGNSTCRLFGHQTCKLVFVLFSHFRYNSLCKINGQEISRGPEYIPSDSDKRGTREMDKKAAGREEEQHEQQRQLPRPTMIWETC